MNDKGVLVAMILVCCALSACGTQRSGEQSVAKQASDPQQSAAQTPNAIEEVYAFRRKGTAARTASNNPVEGIKLVEGNINGLIVLKGEVKESQSKDNPSKMAYTVSYELINGSEIAAIDQEGVHQDSDKIVFLNVSQEGTPPDDNEVLETGMNISEQAMMPVLMARTPAGGLVVRISGRSKSKQRTTTDALLGEYRVDPQTKKGRIMPALEVNTAGGMVTIPVQNIPKFKEKAK